MVNEEYDSPDDITSVELTIQAVSGNTSPAIYANGRNQLPVEIIAKAVKENEDGNEVVLNFSHDTWIHILNLRHAESDEKLNREGSSGWCFSSSENEYSREVVTTGLSSTENSPTVHLNATGQTLITLYVYTDDVNTKRIAVSIDTDDGKHFTTADNASGAEKSSVKVLAIQAIDYHNGNHIEIVKDSAAVLSESLHYTSRILATNYDHYTGEALRNIVRLKSTLGYLFVTHSLEYLPIRNEDCSTGHDQHWNLMGMSAIGDIEESGQYGFPCAVIGHSVPDTSFDVYLWYSRLNNIAFRHGWLSERWTAGRYYYCYFRTDSLTPENHINDNENGEVTLLLYTFRCWEHNTSTCWWNSVRRTPEVHVIDNYGNEGAFNLTFNNDEVGFI